jgi:hypothetical protein
MFFNTFMLQVKMTELCVARTDGSGASMSDRSVLQRQDNRLNAACRREQYATTTF